MTGRIVKALSGFYYVFDYASGNIYACKARGVFRKKNVHPLVGDEAEFVVTHEHDREGNIEKILPRSSAMARPPVANCDLALLVTSVHTPDINFSLIDRYLVVLQHSGLTPVLVFSKSDLNTDSDEEEIRRVYGGSGFEIHFISTVEGSGIDELRGTIEHHVSTVAGPSGAGKSSLLNALTGKDELETSRVSEHTGRGRQTTRHTELVALSSDTFICDTPGFSTVFLPKIKETELRDYYPEFVKLQDGCRFRSCVHINEPSCAVKDAVESGGISRIRYENYCRSYDELKDINRRNFK
ncbi:MAG: ribosome small subunit-dependent GTPase A [Lachnospiraceae bacterium]|uniref:Small ribosomal subunit biogenesis GTPase RsgA n=1 Tax=Candidatus Weimeria bifida TaxID=2599074 RepID=A0A6N7J032_9FIRM|nr:ribosome small subunit-dependent GTPase A [Candidatus Weimeria bifida]RRF96664.1 MAG: ribosome small subunit-dependent GTPase A [Lachnospiraceae bacterium]